MHRNGAVRNGLVLTALVTAGALTLAACGSSSTGGSSPSSGGSSSGVKTVLIGIVASKTGAQAPLFGTMATYVQDRIDKANATNEVPGIRFKTVVVDDQSTPAGELAAAQDLVQNKHVFGIIEADALGFASYRYLVGTKIPVISPGFDGPEYGDPANVNLFPEEGSFDPHNHSVTTFGSMLKSQGVTKVAVLGDGNSPSSSVTVKVIAASAKNAGLQVPYVGTSATFETTDFTQIAVDVKNSGADGVITELLGNQNAALETALKQDGVTPKAFFVPTGYGTDTTSSPALTAAAQGVDFELTYEPLEDNTTASKALAADLQKYANISSQPSFAAGVGWFTGDLFVHGMSLAGANPTPASYVANLRKETDYDPYGMYHPGINYSVFGKQTATLAPGNCVWVVKLEGKVFVPLKGADPACGTDIPNSNQS